MTAPERAPLGAALALLLTVVSLTGDLSPTLMAALVAFMGVLIGIAWPSLLELPSPRGTRVIVAGGGILSAAVVLFAADHISPLAGIVMVCAVGVFASFVHQMLRGQRHQLTISLTGTVAGTLVTAISATWVLAQSEAVAAHCTGLVTAIGAGLAATLLLDATPLPQLPRFIVAIAVGAAVTAALLMAAHALALPIALLVGAVVAVGGASTHLLLGSALASRDPVPALVVAAGPVATISIVAYLAVVLLV